MGKSLARIRRLAFEQLPCKPRSLTDPLPQKCHAESTSCPAGPGRRPPNNNTPGQQPERDIMTWQVPDNQTRTRESKASHPLWRHANASHANHHQRFLVALIRRLTVCESAVFVVRYRFVGLWLTVMLRSIVCSSFVCPWVPCCVV